MGKKHKIPCIEAIGVMPSITVALYHDRNKLSRDLRERGIEQHLSANCSAQTFHDNYGKGEIYFVMMEDCWEKPLWFQLAILAHEASHIVSYYFDDLGEEEPGEEERAYAMEAVAGCLFDAHLAWLEKRKGKNNGNK